MLQTPLNLYSSTFFETTGLTAVDFLSSISGNPTGHMTGPIGYDEGNVIADEILTQSHAKSLQNIMTGLRDGRQRSNGPLLEDRKTVQIGGFWTSKLERQPDRRSGFVIGDVFQQPDIPWRKIALYQSEQHMDLADMFLNPKTSEDRFWVSHQLVRLGENDFADTKNIAAPALIFGRLMGMEGIFSTADVLLELCAQVFSHMYDPSVLSQVLMKVRFGEKARTHRFDYYSAQRMKDLLLDYKRASIIDIYSAAHSEKTITYRTALTFKRQPIVHIAYNRGIIKVYLFHPNLVNNEGTLPAVILSQGLARFFQPRAIHEAFCVHYKPASPQFVH